MLRRSFLRALLGLAAFLLAPLRARAVSFSPAISARLASFAAVIVPAWNEEPAAGTGDFVARFEALARVRPERADVYDRHFERFVAEVDARVPPRDPPDAAALTALFQAWHDEWRREPRPTFAARFFELLRSDVLRTYYASAAGWRSLGYAGPAHRRAPGA